MWIQPVTDRTLSDVEFARFNPFNAKDLKGALNASDWNRITGNIHHLAAILTGYGYHVKAECKTSWATSTIPRRLDILSIRTDVQRIRDALTALSSTPIAPDLPLTHFQKINDIEKILLDYLQLATNMAKAFRELDTFSLGGDLI